MNEWLAFGTVAVICGLLAALTRWAGSEGGDQQPPDTPAAPWAASQAKSRCRKTIGHENEPCGAADAGIAGKPLTNSPREAMAIV